MVGHAQDRRGGRGRRPVVPGYHRRLRDSRAVGVAVCPSRYASRAARAAFHQAGAVGGRRGNCPAGGRVTAVKTRRMPNVAPAGGIGGREASSPQAGTAMAAPPEPLPREAFDSHCHLDIMGAPVPDVLAAARAVGITRVVTIGCDLPSSRWAAQCAADHDGVYGAVAIHPNETAKAARSAPRASSDAVPAETVPADAVPAETGLAESGALAALPQ